MRHRAAEPPGESSKASLAVPGRDLACRASQLAGSNNALSEPFEQEAWEAEAARAEELGMRVVRTRTGVVLSESGGALEKMLPPFKLGVGGPVAGGGQYVPWVHVDDVVGAMLFVLDTPAARGPVNVTAPEPVTNRELSRALGRVLHRPALAPVPGLGVKLLYGEMSTIVTNGQRAVPARLEELGYRSGARTSRTRCATRPAAHSPGRHRGWVVGGPGRVIHP